MKIRETTNLLYLLEVMSFISHHGKIHPTRSIFREALIIVFFLREGNMEGANFILRCLDLKIYDSDGVLIVSCRDNESISIKIIPEWL